MAFDRAFAAVTIFCEASGASPLERRCIAWTMRNRLRSARYGKTIAEICLRHFQFSEWNDDKPDNDNLMRGARAADADPVMIDSVRAFDEALAGAADPTGGATHYHDKSIARAAVPWAAPPAEVALEPDRF